MNDNFFTFRKIKVTGFNKLDAIIEFGSKLTILYGVLTLEKHTYII